MDRYTHLFTSLDIGNITVRNRLMQTAHGKGYGVGNRLSQRDFDYKVARAAGGIGLMITGSRPVHPTGAQWRATVAYADDATDRDRELTKAIHDHGAAIFAQLAHVGFMMSSDGNDDPRVLWSSSAMPSPYSHEVAKEMDTADIADLVRSFRIGAEVALAGGYDGIELHFAHSYLVHQFLSPMFNRREDEYGGSLENRLRLPIQIIDAVRTAAGPDVVLGVRLGMSDFLEGAYTLTDVTEVAVALDSTSSINYLSLSAAGFNKGFEIAPSDVPDGHLVEMAAEVKKAVGELPTFVIGGLKDPAQADEIIRTNRADMVAMTRTMIADPDFARKVHEGREDEVYHCIRANQGCISRVFRGMSVACTVNPATGREGRFGPQTLESAKPPRTWLVVGGGPAGMKAAEVLARRGHTVTLVEKEERLGGQVNLILETPGRESFRWLITDLTAQLEKLGVDVQLGVEASVDFVSAMYPDGVIIATGALPSRTGYSMAAPLVPNLPGAELPHVITPWEVLAGSADIGQNVLVVDDDGTRYAAGTAEVLLDRGKTVELITNHPTLFPSTATTLDRVFVYERLFTKGLVHRLNTWVSEIGPDRVEVYNLYSGERDSTGPIDTVVLAMSRVANDSLYGNLKGQVEQLHRIGDSLAPRSLDHAIYEGFMAGRELWSLHDRQIRAGELEAWRN